MVDVKMLLWLFPILFIFHDFEELILIENWVNCNKDCLIKKFPKAAKKVMSGFQDATTSSLAVGVLEEFLIISIITIIAYLNNSYGLWIGAFLAFTLHLVMHCFQAIMIKRYVPSIITSIICLPICIWILKEMVNLITLSDFVLYSVLAVIIMIVNLKLIHKYIFALSKYKWLK